MDLARVALLVSAATAAGAVNSIAGGGSLLSFPAAVAAGLPPVVANASNAVALTPAALASGWAYRREVAAEGPAIRLLAAPAALGGLAGAALLLFTPARIFEASVPALVLLATLLLLAQNLRVRRGDEPDEKRAEPTTAPAPVAPLRQPARAVVLQFLVAVYGGYFGAGMGIMMLALLSSLGRTDIHRMNAAKIVLGAVVNGTATVGFLVAKAVDPTATLIMMAGGIVGGFTGAAIARRVNKGIVRWAVVAIGFGLTALLAWRRWS